MSVAIEHLQGLFTFPIAVFCVLIGIVLLVVDEPKLRKQRYHKESSIARLLGTAYIIGSIAVFIVFKII